MEHPAFAEKLPSNAEIFFMPEDDSALCEANQCLIETQKRRSKSAPIVIIRIGRLAPAKSRIVRPRVEM